MRQHLEDSFDFGENFGGDLIQNIDTAKLSTGK